MTNKIEVTQADRDAAADFACQPHQDKLRSGEWDSDPAIQALAAHRTRNDAQVQGLVSALRRIAKDATSPREMCEIAEDTLAAWEGQQ